MTNASEHVLKSENVKVEGQFHLDLRQSAPDPGGQRNKTTNNAQAKIVEKKPEFAVLEIACSCGKITHVKCEYNNEQAAN